jgi:hypothetical protein
MSPRRIKIITWLLLGPGLSAGLAIYLLAAPPPPEDPFLATALDNKKYRRELAVYGGNANVVAADFMDWFSGLWHGRALGGTVAVLTIVTTLGFRVVVALPPMPREEPFPPPAPKP